MVGLLLFLLLAIVAFRELLWNESLCLPQIHILTSIYNPQCDGTQKWGL